MRTSPCLTKGMKNFICRFAQQWEDFRIPELESVARMQKVNIIVNREDYSNKVTQNNHSSTQ